VHETGHVVGMYLAGYKNIKLLFVPLFGAAAMGSDKGVKPYKRVLVYFAGPVPGILIGFFGFWLMRTGNMPILHPSDALSFVLILLFINYFNLLPVIPFDGGQILNTIIFSRYSILQFIFAAVSVIALLTLAVKMEEPLLFILPFFVFLSYRNIFSRSKLILKLKDKYPYIRDFDEKETQTRIFESLKEVPHNTLEFQKKVLLAQYVEKNLDAPKAALPTVILTLVFYAALFIAPVYYFVSTNSIFYRFFKHQDPCEVVRQTSLPKGETVSPSSSRFERIDAGHAKDFELVTYRNCFLVLEKEKPEQGTPEMFTPPHADFLSRLWTLYGKPDKIKNGFSYTLKDKKTNLIFSAYMENMAVCSYGGDGYDVERLIPSLYVFEKLLKDTPRSDCRIEIDVDYSEMMKETGFLMDKKSREYLESKKTKLIIGCKDGVPFYEVEQY
jgi:hypothetical protein